MDSFKAWPSVLFLALLVVAPQSLAVSDTTSLRTLLPEDVTLFKDLSDPHLSPDGKTVVYVVTVIDLERDKKVSNLWLAQVETAENRALTFGFRGASHPRFSPDGKWIAFLSGREDDNENDQVWMLSTKGGEAEKLTDAKGGVEDFAWSPDSRQLVLVIHDPEPEAEKHGKEKTAPPIVIERLVFKKDITGYLTNRYSHLQVLTLNSRKIEVLTSGNYDDLLPSWSPDGKEIAFVSKRGDEPDRSENWDVYVIAARVGAKERQLTSTLGSDPNPNWESPPEWSPDGKQIAYLQGGDPKKIAYATNTLAVVPSSGGPSALVTKKLDRNIYYPRFSRDGKSVFAVIEDDGVQYLAQVRLKDGQVDAVTTGRNTVVSFDISDEGKIVALVSTPQRPSEIFSVEKSKLRDLTKQNDEVIKQFRLARVEETKFTSSDGAEVHGFITHALEKTGKSPPAGILYLHGGPQAQYLNEFEFMMQLLAAHGYTVVMPNPRGSTGRGTDYSMGIYADWGNKDVQDDLAAMNDAIARGLVDADRLGVGGWSYGGISTNYIIATTTRFKAAISGASISNILAGYGTDQYLYWYEAELGEPWKDPKKWLRLSYPFLHADRIKTPTLFLCGESDFNVPVLNSEQMYQALRSLGVPTKLIIYPGQYHGLSKPSYIIDRYKRYLAWYAKWIPSH